MSIQSKNKQRIFGLDVVRALAIILVLFSHVYYLIDLNHPSIVLWSNGNEGGHNKELDDDYAKYDFSKRTVIHAHHRPGNAINGIDCNHYEDYYSTQKILNDSLIYMPTEMLHAQDDGGGGAAMEDFWNLHWKSQKSGGVFIWVFADEAVMRTDLNNALDKSSIPSAKQTNRILICMKCMKNGCEC